jgi:hypothetical protein
MYLFGYKLAFLRAIFLLFSQFVGQVRVEWVSYLEVIINLINSIKNNSVKVVFTVQIFEKNLPKPND